VVLLEEGREARLSRRGTGKRTTAQTAPRKAKYYSGGEGVSDGKKKGAAKRLLRMADVGGKRK